MNTNLKYVNVIIDKENFVKKFADDVVNSRNDRIKDYEICMTKHKEKLQSKVRSHAFNTLVCLIVGIILFAAYGKYGFLLAIPVLLYLISFIKYYFDLKALKAKLDLNDAILKFDEVVFNANIKSVKSTDFQKFISCEEAHKSQDGLVFLHLFYAHEIKSIKYVDDTVVVTYVNNDAIETYTLKEFEKKDSSGLYDSISYVHGLLLLGNNGTIMSHATDSKELEVL